MVHADVELLDAGAERDAVESAITEKYASFRTAGRAAARRDAEHYAVESAVLRLTPVGRLVTWDNSKLRLR